MLGNRNACEYYLRIQDFDYKLPAQSIAAHPAPRRDASRLMVVQRDGTLWKHACFSDLPRILRPRSLLVVNDTRVIPARLHGHKPSGGRVEVLLVRPRIVHDRNTSPWCEEWETLIRGFGSGGEGAVLTFEDGVTAEVISRGERGAAMVRFRGEGPGGLLAVAQRIGSIPLPPYIEAARRRAGEGPSEDDRQRYQTVYARESGAVAAPTAGLHFTEALLDEVRAAGHELAALTLHVGPGTFRPVESEDPRSHHMDAEPYDVPPATAEAVNRARAEGRPVVAVGTTVVRALEAAAAGGELVAGPGSTDLYLLPGATFRVVTDLITNFHLPRSTLLMLVAAFSDRQRILAAYEEAVRAGYRFYSYGDAMLLRPGAWDS
jgi:S-adenosylmethionine:tRNA ribosyltransferase-isomerase